MPFHMGDMRMIATEALKFVQNLQKHPEDEISTSTMISLGIDIEKDDIGFFCNSSFDVSEEHRVCDFGFEELNRLFILAFERMALISQ